MQRIVFATIACLLLIATARACNIPVFRYALERWKPDACEISVVYEDDLNRADQTILEELGKSSNQLQIKTKQVPGGKDYGKATAEVSCRDTGGRPISIWRGDLENLHQLRLAQSPARQELHGRLLKGDSVIWLMIKSQNTAKNKAAHDRLQERFKLLGDKVQLPQGIGVPGSELFSDIPLLLQFSILTIDRDDPNERFLLTLFRKLNHQAFRSDEPIFVPVFGRGRALDVIPADQLSDTLIDDLTVFLAGACSCQVKERNPGFDLLISADWDTDLFGADGEAPADSPLGQQQDQQQDQRQDNAPAPLQIPPGR